MPHLAMNERLEAPIGCSVWEIPTATLENILVYHLIPQSLDLPTSLLTRQGYKALDGPDAGLLARILAGGLVSLVAVQGQASGTRQLWAKDQDIVRARQRPVILAFRLPPEVFAALPPDTRRLVIAESLPPAGIGSHALILVRGIQGLLWSVTNIAEQGETLAQQIQEALQDLVGPTGWRPYHPVMGEMLQAGIERVYQEKRRNLLASLKNTMRPDAWKAINEELRDLDDIRAYVRAKEQSHQRENEESRAKWREVQMMAQQLLDLYWQAHLEAQKGMRPHGPSVVIDEAVWAMADEVLYKITNRMRNAAARASRWQQASPAEPPYYQEDNVMVRILPQQPDEPSVLEPHPLIEGVLAKRPQVLRDQDISNLIALLVHWVTTPESLRTDGYLWTEVTAILDYRGLAPKQTIENGHQRRAGHQEASIQAAIDSIERLAYLWADVEVKITGPKTAKVRQGRLIEIKNRWKTMRIQEDGTLKEQATMWLWRPGEALQGITSRGIFLQQIVKYNHHDEKWELALALLFTFLLGFAAKGTKGAFTVDYTYEIRLSTLLEKGSLMENEEYARLHPRQMLREPFERAMNRLEADGIVTHWRYRESSDALSKKGWLDTWLGSHIQVNIGRLLLDPSGGIKGYRQIIDAKKARRDRQEQQRLQKGDASKRQSKTPR